MISRNTGRQSVSLAKRGNGKHWLGGQTQCTELSDGVDWPEQRGTLDVDESALRPTVCGPAARQDDMAAFGRLTTASIGGICSLDLFNREEVFPSAKALLLGMHRRPRFRSSRQP